MKTKLFLLTLVILTWSCKPNSEKSQDQTTENETNPTEETVVPDASSTSENSLDYEGTYTGIIPCADCEGIKTTLVLFYDDTYMKNVRYLGKEDKGTTYEGDYTWNDKGSAITIYSSNGDTQMYQVGENVLFHLNRDGERITGDLAEKYMLPRDDSHNAIENTKWILTELNGAPVKSTDQMQQAYIIFNSAESRLAGNNGCNRFNASYELKDMGRIKINPAASTLMACPEMTIADGFNEVIDQADNFTVVDGVLSLNKARMAPLAKFKSN